ncbi:alpha/beta hydrolase [Secundilactobacillus similis]|uniref:Phospholipase carboxylesterase family protein n=1 Tax=Secundilactobacillus similis DSM 23365 = JCM 2765 TaxID=1423804 RepID=A0A0R2EUR5_9LACO|nr:alpha/beta hydrolase fold domain-containing protein [Secundilactobacillus similis]KRN20014.1 phospholipase carboxylesterase family protein [Secundilactobacillus similis DSM 23365 = JCM 2765]
MTDQTIHSAFFPGDDQLAPVLMLHGTGGDESDLLPIATFLFPQHPKLGIRGRIRENGANRYFIRHDHGDFDLANLSQETDWLLGAIESESQRLHLDAKRMIVLGFSNGANVAAYAWLHKRPPFRTGILLHPMLIDPASTTANLDDVQAFASFGDVDPLITERNFNQLTQQFTIAGANLTSFKNHQSHRPSQAELAAARNWVQHLT